MPEFPIHIPREGEPTNPPFKRPSSMTKEEGQLYEAWLDWSDTQPDRLMLAHEWITRGYMERGSFKREDIPTTMKSLAQLASGLRAEGYNDLIDTSWPHLKPYEAEIKP